MKALLLLFTLSLFSQLNAAEITAKPAGGEWSSNTTWIGNISPVEGDVVIIPSGVTVTFNSTPYPSNNPTTRPRLTINIYGILDFSGAGNNKLYLDNGSRIQIFSTGQIRTTSNSTEIIAIYTGTGTTDNIVWEGTPSTITGPRYATSTSSSGTANYGFAAGVLPVTLLSFTGDHNRGQVQLKWKTAEELHTTHFDVERSADSKQWSVVATLPATGPYSSYQATDQAPLGGHNQYRLKVKDWDGKITYSPVIRVAANNALSVQISPNPARSFVQVSLSSIRNKSVSIELINSTGQIVKTEKHTSPATNLFKLDVSTVPRGIYTLVIRDEASILESSKLQLQ